MGAGAAGARLPLQGKEVRIVGRRVAAPEALALSKFPLKTGLCSPGRIRPGLRVKRAMRASCYLNDISVRTPGRIAASDCTKRSLQSARSKQPDYSQPQVNSRLPYARCARGADECVRPYTCPRLLRLPRKL